VGFEHLFAMKKPEGDCEFWSFCGLHKNCTKKRERLFGLGFVCNGNMII
jgi:hypothetical protein